MCTQMPQTLLVNVSHDDVQAGCKPKLKELITGFRQGHSLVAVIYPLPLEQIFFSRPQRILCYYCELQMALAIMAIFFGAEQEGKLAVRIS